MAPKAPRIVPGTVARRPDGTVVVIHGREADEWIAWDPRAKDWVPHVECAEPLDPIGWRGQVVFNTGRPIHMKRTLPHPHYPGAPPVVPVAGIVPSTEPVVARVCPKGTITVVRASECRQPRLAPLTRETIIGGGKHPVYYSVEQPRLMVLATNPSAVFWSPLASPRLMSPLAGPNTSDIPTGTLYCAEKKGTDLMEIGTCSEIPEHAASRAVVARAASTGRWGGAWVPMAVEGVRTPSADARPLRSTNCVVV